MADSLSILNAAQIAQIVATFMPPGTVVSSAAPSTPNGWLACDGTSYSAATYPNLFAAIGTTYGGGGGNFNVPDLRGRVAAGVGAVGTNQQPTLPLAGTGGEQAHTLTVPESPSHNHSVTDSGHSHSDAGHTHGPPTGSTGYVVNSGGGASALIPQTGARYYQNVTPTGPGHANISGSNAQFPSGSGSTGGGGSHNNMQPYIALNMIIKT